MGDCDLMRILKLIYLKLIDKIPNDKIEQANKCLAVKAVNQIYIKVVKCQSIFRLSPMTFYMNIRIEHTNLSDELHI